MRWIQMRGFSLLLVVLAMGLFFSAWRHEAEGKAPLPRERVPRGKSVLRGKIILKGDAPDLEKLTGELRKEIGNKVDQKDYCLKCEDLEKSQQLYRLGGPENNQVGNVFVWIAPEIGSFFTIDDKQLEEASKREVVIRQPHCVFIPTAPFSFRTFVPILKMPDAFSRRVKSSKSLTMPRSLITPTGGTGREIRVTMSSCMPSPSTW